MYNHFLFKFNGLFIANLHTVCQTVNIPINSMSILLWSLFLDVFSRETILLQEVWLQSSSFLRAQLALLGAIVIVLEAV